MKNNNECYKNNQTPVCLTGSFIKNIMRFFQKIAENVMLHILLVRNMPKIGKFCHFKISHLHRNQAQRY